MRPDWSGNQKAQIERALRAIKESVPDENVGSEMSGGGAGGSKTMAQLSTVTMGTLFD